MPTHDKPLLQPPQIETDALQEDLDLYDLFGAEDGFDCEETAAQNALFESQDASYTFGKGAEFKGCILRRCTLRGAQWKAPGFTDVIFEHCDFSNIRFSQSYFQRVQFIGCKMLGADLAQAHMRNVVFRDCMMRMVNLNGSVLNGVQFIGCDAQEAAMQSLPDMKRVSFRSCDFTRSEWMHTQLKGVDLTTNRIDGILVTGSYELHGAIVTPVQAMELSRLLGIVIQE